jgi:hypothetical protein
VRPESFHTGPTIVRQIAEKCREAGLTVACEGTERVYVEAPVESYLDGGPRLWILARLREVHGTDFGLR